MGLKRKGRAMTEKKDDLKNTSLKPWEIQGKIKDKMNTIWLLF